MSAPWIELACVALLAACGGGHENGAPGTSAGDAVVGTVNRDTRTVVVFMLDGLRGDLDADVAPRLADLRADALRYVDHVTVCTGTNAAVASLMTGLRPEEHGLGSLHDRGRASLADEIETIAESYRAAGWRTHAVVSSAQLGLSALQQGFDTFEAPVLSERSGRSARQSYDLTRAQLEEQLADDRPVFLLVHLADLRGDDAPDEAGRHLERYLGEFAEPGSPLAAILATARDDPAQALADARGLLGRARGSASYNALTRALHAGRLAVLDQGVAAFLALVDHADRLDDALVAVTSTRGVLLAPPQRSGGPTFLPEVLRVPLWLRLPGASARGDVRGTASSIDLAPTLLGVLDGPPAELAGEDLLGWVEHPAERTARVVLACDARFERFAAFDADAHVEPNSASPRGGVAFSRTGIRLLIEPQAADAQDPLAHLHAALGAVPRFGLRVDSTLPELEVRWRLAEGQVRAVDVQLVGGGTADTAGGGMRGQATLASAGHVQLVGSRRDLALRLTLIAAKLMEDQVAIGAGTPIPMTLLPRLASADAPPWPEDAEPQVTLVHDGGVWARLSIPGAAAQPVEAIVALYPPDPQRRDVLEWSAPFDVEVTMIPGRTDAVRIQGTTPFELQLKELPKTKLAFAVRVGEFTVAPSAVRIDDRSMGAPGIVDLYVPDWLAGVTPLLEEPASDFPPPVLIRRTGQRAPFAGRALTSDEQFFVRFLGAGE